MVSAQGTAMVYDPVNKKGYELKYGGESPELYPTEGLTVLFEQLRTGGTKRVFLCKKFQNRQCRLQAHCNSIHACRRTIAKLRDQYPAQAEEEITVFAEDENERFSVSLRNTEDTQGRAAVLSGTASEGHLCIPFELNGCFLGLHCPRVHVDHKVMRSMRSLWNSPCCSDPKCSSDKGVDTTLPLLGGVTEWSTYQLGTSRPHPKSALAPTKGLREICASHASDTTCLIIPQSKLCKPHLRKACKWGEDCSNVHICRRSMKRPADPNAKSSPKSTPPSSARVSPRSTPRTPTNVPFLSSASPVSTVAVTDNSDSDSSGSSEDDVLETCLDSFRRVIPMGGIYDFTSPFLP